MRSRGGEEQRRQGGVEEGTAGTEVEEMLGGGRMNSLLCCEGSGSVAWVISGHVWEFVDVRLLASPHVWFFQTVALLPNSHPRPGSIYNTRILHNLVLKTKPYVILHSSLRATS